MSGACEKVQGITIDELGFDQINFMKVDVEGMELNVLKGAEKSIYRYRPFMLVEYLKGDKPTMIAWLRRADYVLYTGIGGNYLCLPKECRLSIEGLTLVL